MTSSIYEDPSKQRDEFENDREAEERVSPSDSVNANVSMISAPVLHPDEQDEDVPDEKLEDQLGITKETLLKI